MNIIGFTKEEADEFGFIVSKMMEAKEGRRKVKKPREKKPPKMKRAELLKRLKEFLEHAVLSVTTESVDEWLLLREELKKVVK